MKIRINFNNADGVHVPNCFYNRYSNFTEVKGFEVHPEVPGFLRVDNTDGSTDFINSNLVAGINVEG